MEKQYTPYFKDPLFECTDCKNCASKSRCFQENLSEKCEKMKEAARKFYEACPAGSTPKNGGCMNSTKDKFLRGVCDIGYSFDNLAGSNGKCVHNTDDKKHQPRSER